MSSLGARHFAGFVMRGLKLFIALLHVPIAKIPDLSYNLQFSKCTLQNEYFNIMF